MMPTYGIDATGADTYVEIIAARTGHDEFRHVWAYCATKDALVSLDGGTTANIRVPAGVVTPIISPDDPITKAIQGKNADAGQNYANLIVWAW